MVYKFFDKESSDSGIKNGNISNKQLAEELHKWNIRKINKRKEHSPLIDTICGEDFAYMQLIGQFNRGFRFCYEIYNKYGIIDMIWYYDIMIIWCFNWFAFWFI